MQNWSTVVDIRTQLEKAWLKGQFLNPGSRDCEYLFPFVIKLKHPTSAELEKDFSSCQQWVKQFKDSAFYRIEWKQINHRRFGRNQLAVAAVFDSMQALLVFLGKRDEHRLFHQLSARLLSVFPAMDFWLSRYPFKALKNVDAWEALIAVSQWMLANPRPGIYIRQIPLPQIDTKLIEQHKRLLSEWWEFLLDEEDIDDRETGIKRFEQRYGFKSKPLLLRFRILDPTLYIQGLSDISITAEAFSSLQLNIETVFVTENDINSLVFPDAPNAIVLFGRGYGFEYLQQINWLDDLNIYYWGDIDTHGFAILNQFRQYLPQTRSFLMDESTLLSHRRHWVKEPRPTRVDLPYLELPEQRLYDKLRDNQFGESLRLEQEYIRYVWLEKALTALV